MAFKVGNDVKENVKENNLMWKKNYFFVLKKNHNLCEREEKKNMRRK